MKTSTHGTGTTGLHVFQSGASRDDVFSGHESGASGGTASTAKWDAMSDEEKQPFNAQAANLRRLASVKSSKLDTFLTDVQKDEPLEGPWAISSRGGKFPIHPQVITDALAGTTMEKLANMWKARVHPTVMADPLFDSIKGADGPQVFDIPDDLKDNVTVMLDAVRLTLRFEAGDRRAGTVLEFRSGTNRIYAYVSHSMHLERDAFEAEAFLLLPTYQAAVDDDHMDDNFGGRGPPAPPWDHFRTTDLCFMLSLCCVTAELGILVPRTAVGRVGLGPWGPGDIHIYIYREREILINRYIHIM